VDVDRFMFITSVVCPMTPVLSALQTIRVKLDRRLR
jgi:hypothetical protein